MAVDGEISQVLFWDQCRTNAVKPRVYSPIQLSIYISIYMHTCISIPRQMCGIYIYIYIYTIAVARNVCLRLQIHSWNRWVMKVRGTTTEAWRYPHRGKFLNLEVLLCHFLPLQGSYVCKIGVSCWYCGTGCRSVAMVAPLASSGLARCKVVLHGYENKPIGGGGLYWLVTVWTHGDFIVLPHWNIRPPTPWSAIPLSQIFQTLTELVIALS